jgi:hypothetical protein
VSHPIKATDLQPEQIVIIAPFEDIPRHLFQIDDIFEDCVSGYSLNGPLKGVYGEPGLEMIEALAPGEQGS